MQTQEEKTAQDYFTSRVLVVMGGTVSSELAKFSDWMMIGYGAAIGLIVSNLDKVNTHLSTESIQCAVKLYLVATVFHIVQRFLAARIAAMVAVTESVSTLSLPSGFEHPRFIESIITSIWYPVRWWASRSMRKNDPLLSGRLSSRLSQSQMVLAFIQTGLLISSAWQIANGFRHDIA